MKKIFHVLGWVIIFGNLAFLGLIAWWLVHPYPLPEMKQPIPITNENHIIAVGEPIKMDLQVTKTREMSPSVVIRTITCNDGNLVTMASDTKNLPLGTYTIHSDSFILPPKVAKGATCRFNFSNTYKLNPLRSETVNWTSEDFKVKG